MSAGAEGRVWSVAAPKFETRLALWRHAGAKHRVPLPAISRPRNTGSRRSAGSLDRGACRRHPRRHFVRAVEDAADILNRSYRRRSAPQPRPICSSRCYARDAVPRLEMAGRGQHGAHELAHAVLPSTGYTRRLATGGPPVLKTRGAGSDRQSPMASASRRLRPSRAAAGTPPRRPRG